MEGLIQQFFSDIIHLTQGEFFVKYWWLWVILFSGIAILYAIVRILERRRDIAILKLFERSMMEAHKDGR